MRSWIWAALAADCTSSSVASGRAGEVVTDGCVEKVGLLRDHADRPGQRPERELAHVVTVEADSAGGDVLQAGDQIADGGLAGSAGADDGSELARLPHVAQPNLTTCRPDS